MRQIIFLHFRKSLLCFILIKKCYPVGICAKSGRGAVNKVCCNDIKLFFCKLFLRIDFKVLCFRSKTDKNPVLLFPSKFL